MKAKFKRLRTGKTNTRTGGALQRALSLIAAPSINKTAVPKGLSGVIRRVVKGTAESKQVTFYQSTNDGTSTARAAGDFINRGWAVQNGKIATLAPPAVNNLDVHQIIPYCQEGTGDNQRLGNQITPTRLSMQGSVRIRIADVETSRIGQDLKVVIYILQHVNLKSYQQLYNSNNFAQLLETGQQLTVNFDGQNWHSKLPVSTQNYKLIKKKVITLRYAGVANTTGSNSFAVSVANSHNWYANYNFNLSKHLPKKLKYPENNGTGVVDPTIQNTPTNSSIFMAMGYYNQYEPQAGGTFLTDALIEQTYVSHMTYKDL